MRRALYSIPTFCCSFLVEKEGVACAFVATVGSGSFCLLDSHFAVSGEWVIRTMAQEDLGQECFL